MREPKCSYLENRPESQLQCSKTETELKRLFGKHAVVDEVGKFTLICLDNPVPRERARRIKDFNPDNLFENNCPICKMLKEKGGNVVFDNTW